MGSCSCSIEAFEDADYWGAYFTTVLIARKQHTCVECHRHINVGEMHEKFTGYEDCYWEEIDYRKQSVYRTCSDCLSIRNTYFCTWIWGSVWDDLWEEIREMNGEMIDANVLKLTPIARAKFFGLIEEYWEQLNEEEEEEE